MQDEIFDYHRCLRLARRARRQGDMLASERWARAAHAHLRNLRLTTGIKRDIKDRMEASASRNPPPPRVKRRRSADSVVRQIEREIIRNRQKNPEP